MAAQIPSENWRYHLRRGITDLWFLLSLTIALLLLLVLLGYHNTDPGWSSSGLDEKIRHPLGHTGAYVADAIFSLIGYAAYLLPAGFVIIGWQSARRAYIDAELIAWKFFALVVSVIALACIFSLRWAVHINSLAVTAGGVIGQKINIELLKLWPVALTMIVFTAIFLLGMTLLLEISWLRGFEKIGIVAVRLWNRLGQLFGISEGNGVADRNLRPNRDPKEAERLRRQLRDRLVYDVRDEPLETFEDAPADRVQPPLFAAPDPKDAPPPIPIHTPARANVDRVEPPLDWSPRSHAEQPPSPPPAEDLTIAPRNDYQPEWQRERAPKMPPVADNRSMPPRTEYQPEWQRAPQDRSAPAETYSHLSSPASDYRPQWQRSPHSATAKRSPEPTRDLEEPPPAPPEKRAPAEDYRPKWQSKTAPEAPRSREAEPAAETIPQLTPLADDQPKWQSKAAPEAPRSREAEPAAETYSQLTPPVDDYRPKWQSKSAPEAPRSREAEPSAETIPQLTPTVDDYRPKWQSKSAPEAPRSREAEPSAETIPQLTPPADDQPKWQGKSAPEAPRSREAEPTTETIPQLTPPVDDYRPKWQSKSAPEAPRSREAEPSAKTIPHLTPPADDQPKWQSKSAPEAPRSREAEPITPDEQYRPRWQRDASRASVRSVENFAEFEEPPAEDEQYRPKWRPNAAKSVPPSLDRAELPPTPRPEWRPAPTPVIVPAVVDIPSIAANAPEAESDDDPSLKVHLNAPPPAPKKVADYPLPPLDLLNKGVASVADYSAQELDEMGMRLENALKNYKVNVRVENYAVGPVVTRLELSLAPGVKISTIHNLEKDIARLLAVQSVRIVSSIPGKQFIGIEIPNRKREIVPLRGVLESSAYQRESSPLAMALGVDVSSKPVVVDLCDMPHLLVAGTTGSGKSVGINVMLASMLFKARPADLRLILIDPKMLEMTMYTDIPHLLTPVITDFAGAEKALSWAVSEMERRYQLMAALRVRKIDEFNKAIAEADQNGAPIDNPFYLAGTDTPLTLEKLPYIVIVVDELADLMVQAGKNLEQLITRIAQKARAAGIHLILATQRPSVDVITGLIKSNIPKRIAFQVPSNIDSRTILGSNGAENLLGYGDMLYAAAGGGEAQRVHGAFLDDQEIDRLTTYLRAQGQPQYELSITAEPVEIIARGTGSDN